MKDLEERIKRLVLWMFEAKYLVVFTGAGISTESGLSDFRGPDGIWTRQEGGARMWITSTSVPEFVLSCWLSSMAMSPSSDVSAAKHKWINP